MLTYLLLPAHLTNIVSERPHQASTRAFLLSRVNYKEADLIVTFYCETLGKRACIARGARSSRKRFSGLLEPYALVHIDLDHTQRDLCTLKQVQALKTWPAFFSSYAMLNTAGAALSFLRWVLKDGHPEEGLFQACERLFDIIQTQHQAYDAILMSFYVHVLTRLGYRPVLDRCAKSNRQVPPDRSVLFSARLGSVISQLEGGAPFKLSASARQTILNACDEHWYLTWQDKNTRTQLSDREVQHMRDAIKAFASFQLGDAPPYVRWSASV